MATKQSDETPTIFTMRILRNEIIEECALEAMSYGDLISARQVAERLRELKDER